MKPTNHEKFEYSGLSSQQAHELLKQHGYNELPEESAPSWVWIFITQFASPLIYILLIAAVLIFFVADDRLDAFIIVGILLFNALVGTIQEGRTRKILGSLKRLIVSDCVVMRDNKKVIINTRELVPEDIILVQEGQRVPADARIIESYSLTIDEAMLTGESTPVKKERDAIIYSGTYILSGSARAQVIATGIKTEIGKIHQSVQQIQTDVPLAREMARLSWWIVCFIFVVCILLFVIGIISGLPLKELLVTLIALFICVIPEGLPVVLTLVLVTGVYRMARKKVLVKNMQAVEGLGHAQVIVIDKTGTLTRNEMIVTHVFADNRIYTVSGKGYYSQGSLFFENEPVTVARDTDLYQMAQALYLLNTTTLAFISEQGTFDVKGDPTEAALFVFAQKVGIDAQEIEQQFKKIYEIPFGAQHKYHAVFIEHNNQGVAFIAGSPELIMHLDGQSDMAQKVFSEFLARGLRIIGIGTKKFDPALIPGEHASDQERAQFYEKLINHDVTFLGICGIEDSIRAEAASTIANARKAGLHIIMATGDHQRTALSIAKQVGIYQEGDEAIDGPEFDSLSDSQLKDMVIHTTVFSRVRPEQKLRIIKAIHAHGMIVAMTGDGINDAPSLVAADIGIGMGAIGTEVAKEASDIVLLDDSVINIIHAIEEGRHTIYTLRRVVLYFFSTNLAEILIILFAFVFSLLYPSLSLVLPLTAAQILWLNLVTDGFLDSALSLEEKEKKILFEREWLLRRHRLIDASILWRMVYAAIPMAIGSLFVFLLYSPLDITLARTMTLVTLGMFQWFNAWNCRSDVQSIFQLGLLSNPWLVLATVLVFLLQLALLHIPFLQRIFATQPLNIYQWIFVTIIASSILWIEEIRKGFVRRRQR